jgi:hypothetical protein
MFKTYNLLIMAIIYSSSFVSSISYAEPSPAAVFNLLESQQKAPSGKQYQLKKPRKARRSSSNPTGIVAETRTEEGNVNHTNYFQLAIGSPLSIDVSATYTTRNGTAIAGEDYTFTTGSISIPAGDTRAFIAVEIIADNTAEEDETFYLVLSEPEGANFPNNASTLEAMHTIVESTTPATNNDKLIRGNNFFSTPERFNRYYTDSQYRSNSTLYVSPNGNGNGTNTSPMSVIAALNQVSAGTEVRFLTGEYNGCFGLDSDHSGTYNAPIVLKADPNVTVNCCNTGRKACFNLEFSNHIAIDGFHLLGGDYGVRAVGGYATSEHQTGIALLNNQGENQNKDPFFSGGSDWIVVDNNLAHGAGSGDGHGIYLSNGSDWMIVRNNELYNNASSDLQINADPISTCEDENIAYTDPRCDGSALEGQGQGVSEFVLIENNYLHNSEVGPNFTSMRNSIIRNNIIGFYARHNTSFWQETDNPKLGSSNNIIEHNLFIGDNNRHVLQLINNSGNNTVRNNVLLGLSLTANSALSNSSTLLVEQDASTQSSNNFTGNYLVGGYFENYTPIGTNQQNNNFNLNWFENFPTDGRGNINGFKPTANAPFLDSGQLQTSSSVDIAGNARFNPVDLGPWHVSTTPTTPPPSATSGQYVSYMLNDQALLKEVNESGSMINISQHLGTLDSGNDFWVNISPNGEWLLLESSRLHDECDDWACLIYGKRDLSEFTVVQTNSGELIHPEAFSAISSDGKIIVAQMSLNNRFDLIVSRRTGTRWSEPQVITSASPSSTNTSPALSANGQEVVFSCGNSICLINTDGTGLTTIIDPANRAEINKAGSADFDPITGDIVFEGEENSERIWRYNRTSSNIQVINSTYTNDNSSCVLSDGRIASLWLNRAGNQAGLHELKIMNATGLSHFMATENTDISDIGLGCGGS